MSWKSYFIPQTLLQTSSKYNREIRVNEEFGKSKLLVNGSRQSGEYIKELWQKTFAAFQINKKQKVKNILVLGVAGGTVIHLLNKIYPSAQIIAVDIDKQMIEIGYKYFGLREIKNLTTVEVDAKEFVKNKRDKFDLIIVDLFSGREIPEFVATTEFLKNIKNLLATNGNIVINYLRENEYQKKSQVMSGLLKSIFKNVNDFEIKRNRFFMVKLLHV